MHRAPSRLLRTLARPTALAAAARSAAALALAPPTRAFTTSPGAMLIEQTTLSSASAVAPQEPTVNEEKARQIARDFRT